MGFQDVSVDRATIVLAEDDDATRTFLADHLTADGFDMLVSDSAAGASQRVEEQYPDLLIIDSDLPDRSGLEVLSAIRAADTRTSKTDPRLPVIVLSARCGELDKCRALERGADDIIEKPFSYRELRCRIDALLRRANPERSGAPMMVGELEIHTAARTVLLAGKNLELSNKEFGLLRMLAADPTRVFTKAELLRVVFNDHNLGTTRTLDTHACRLRRKLNANGGHFLQNVWGVGYRLVDPV